MSVWTERDLPVLEALTNAPTEETRHGFLSLGDGAGESLGLELDDAVIHDALLTLRDADYLAFEIGYESGGGAMITHLAITGPGMQALGEWPLFDAATSPATIALLLEQLAPEAPSEQESTNLRKAAGYIGKLAPATFRQLAVGAVTAAVKAQMGEL